MKYSYVLLTIVFLFALLSPAWADDSLVHNSRSGFYIGIGGIYADEAFDNKNGLNFSNEPGINFRLGYRVHPRVAIEAMGERVDAFDLTFNPVEGVAVDGEINTWTGTLNGKFFVLTGKFQPYVLFGAGVMRGYTEVNVNSFGNRASQSVTQNDFVIRYGAGLDAYLTENWLGYLEVSNVQPTGDVNDVNYFSFGGGIQYRF